MLDCVLRGRYLAPEELPSAPVWDRLPDDLRIELAGPLAAGEPRKVVIPLLWRFRVATRGQPTPDSTGERNRTWIPRRLGLMYLAHQAGRLDATELLTAAF